MRFADWHELDDHRSLPSGSGLFQLRLKDGLITYPAGKSAMFYYGYASDIGSGCRQFVADILPKLGRRRDELLLRTMAVADVESQFKGLMQKFSLNFGSMPAGNEIYLQILQNEE